MKKFGLIGYGKMGREIHKIIEQRGGEVALIIDKDNAGDLTVENLQKVDVVIEFSAPMAAAENVRNCLDAGVPVVSGTTGWDVAVAESLCAEKQGKMLWASNFSVGVNLFFAINKQLAAMFDRFSEYDVTLEEVHHTQKLDAPSGTAITIAEGILENISRKNKWTLGHTTIKEELGVAAIRRSVVPGTHTVTWESEVDSIEIRHTAKSRQGFAVGAVLAAEFLAEQQKSGVYSMTDLLK